ncbi:MULTISPECIES: LLM class flavin-dependent oxidoreductase [Protofrankia]|uniref:Luciferase-like domain-containing protein n=1 Tax=Protofrankia coriariae TaxID=1562887 RepID=A0ABR5F1S2_9ACTN|nr:MULTISPECIES: LLM class flavin-dependent oxidoreductase [Protofrankia]KLL10659.1 hypothetical protein FrCorBMG51_16975 [Protofrankia coriariae]
MSNVQTAVWFPGVRGVPAKSIIPYAQRLEQAGVDQVFTWDFLTGILPRVAWGESFSPVANVLPDGDSFYDPFTLLGLAGGATESLGLSVSATNGIRNGPAEIMRMAMTIADASQGNSVVCVGVGEKQNTVPFGYSRKEGLARLEDHFRLYQLLWEKTEPFSFEGNFWHFRNAYIGGARTHRPRMLVAGAGPRALDIAARYADGWLTVVPAAFAHIEHYAQTVRDMKVALEKYGRDPDDFIFAIEAIALIHEDRAAIDKAIDHSEFVTSFASIYGRMAHAEWELEPDVELARPRDYNYTLHLLPNEVTREENDAVMARVSRAMKSRSFVHGNARQVADHWLTYINAGATWVGFLDFAPFVFGLDEAGACLERNIDVCTLLKA